MILLSNELVRKIRGIMDTVNESKLLQNAESALTLRMTKVEADQAALAKASNVLADLDQWEADLNAQIAYLNYDVTHRFFDEDADKEEKIKEDQNCLYYAKTVALPQDESAYNNALSQLEKDDPDQGLVQMGKVLTESLLGHQNSMAYSGYTFADFNSILQSILIEMSAMESLDNATQKQDAEIKYNDFKNLGSASVESQEEAEIAAQSKLDSSLNAATESAQLTNNSAMSSAVGQLSHQSAWQTAATFLGFGSGLDEQSKLIMQSLQALNSLVTSIQKSLKGLDVGNIELDNIIESLNIIIAKVQAILTNPDMSLEQKKTKILALLMVALSLFAEAKQVFSEIKSQLQTKLAQANTKAAKETTQAVEISQADKAALEKTQSKMQEIMKYLNYAFDLLMFIEAPIAFAIVEALSIAGVFKDISNAISDDLQKDGMSQANAQVTADVITAVIQVVMLVGLDKLGDKMIVSLADSLVKSLAKNVSVEGSEELSNETIQLTVKKYFSQGLVNKLPGLVELFAKPAGSLAKSLSDKFAKMSAKAAEKAAEDVEIVEMNVNNASANQASLNSSERVAVASSKNVSGKIAQKLSNLSKKLLTIRTGLSEVVEKAQQEALSTSLVGSDEIEKIAEKSAAKALGDTTKAVDAEGNRLSNLKQEFKKLLESKMFLYGITSLLSIMQNNIIEDAITAAQSDKAKAEKAEAVLNMIEEILEMLLMMLAGAGSKHFDNTSSSFQLMMQKMTALVSVVSGLGQSSLMIGQGVVQKDLATVNSKLIKQSAKLEMLDALLDQINQKQGDEISSSMQEATSFYKQMMDMSNRLSEGEKAQAQVLLSFV